VRRVALVGAGYISQVHADALRAIPGVRVAAIIDPSAEAAARLAASVGGAARFHSVDEALAAEAFDAAHVLVPPHLHAAVATRLLASGKPVLLEKPLAVSSAECAALAEAAQRGPTLVGVNQNFLFHPAFLRLRRLVESGAIGRPSYLDCLYNVPLRQLAARQFGHWMFDAPGNILLEQAVHPLSQIVAIAGEVASLRAIAEPALPLAPGLDFRQSLTVTLACARMPAGLRFAVGQAFPFWQIAIIGDDGVAVADMLANRCYRHARTRYLDPLDVALSSARTGLSLAAEGATTLSDYALSMLRLKQRSDPFFLSMKGSIAAFHAAIDAATRPEADLAFGARLVGLCEALRDEAFGPAVPAPRPARPPAPETWDVAVLGGTGFIGTETVRRFVAAGMRVSVLARSARNLPPIFDDPAVALFRGDIRDPDAVARAIGGARRVVNLAHGGGGASYEAIRAAMVGGAEAIARLCLAKGVERLVHVGSIASLYLGPQDAPVTGTTPPDPRAEERADYARAKAEADRMLLALGAAEGLKLVILRPGLVVGAGTPPLHSGLGFFNNDQHVIGWNRGSNPLPFVLVADVAEAIVAAARVPAIEGRCYNLVGDVRLSAREFVAELSRAMHRPLRFHPQWPTMLWGAELGKWLVKQAGGRRVPLPSRRDILSRGLMARFDCSDAKRDLAWQPVSDHATFIRDAIAVHGR
jgi:predicted dehydrogenase/nucleoside-diphosphate-sugar epimerase